MQKDGDGGDEDDTLSHEKRAVFSRTRKKSFVFTPKQQRSTLEMEEMNKADAIEFRMLAKDVFLKWVYAGAAKTFLRESPRFIASKSLTQSLFLLPGNHQR